MPGCMVRRVINCPSIAHRASTEPSISRLTSGEPLPMPLKNIATAFSPLAITSTSPTTHSVIMSEGASVSTLSGSASARAATAIVSSSSGSHRRIRESGSLKRAGFLDGTDIVFSCSGSLKTFFRLACASKRFFRRSHCAFRPLLLPVSVIALVTRVTKFCCAAAR